MEPVTIEIPVTLIIQSVEFFISFMAIIGCYILVYYSWKVADTPDRKITTIVAAIGTILLTGLFVQCNYPSFGTVLYQYYQMILPPITFKVV